MKRIIFIHMIAFLFVSCQNKYNALTNEVIIDLDVYTEDVPEIREINYIPLETNDSTLIGEIDKILFRNNNFYIFDKQGMKILIFDRHGSFKKSILKKGIGPGEYVLPTDMDVDELGNIYIGDNANKKIIKYITDDYIDYEIIQIDKYFLDFVRLTDQLIYIGDSYHKGSPEIKLAKLDIASGQFNIIQKNEIEKKGFIPRFSKHYFFRSGNELRYYKRFSPTIYTVSNNQVSPSYSIKSKNFPSNEVIKEWSRDKNRILTDNDAYIRDISSFYEAGDYICLTINTKLKNYAIYDKKTRKTYNWGFINDKVSRGIPGAYASDGEYFVSYCTPTKDKIDNILLYNPELTLQMKEHLLKLTEESNPIIILYKF